MFTNWCKKYSHYGTSAWSPRTLISMWKFVTCRYVWGLLSLYSLILHAIPTLQGVTGSLCVSRHEQVEISTLLLTFSLLLKKIPLCHPKIIPLPQDISTWVSFRHQSVSDYTFNHRFTQSAHCEYSSVNDINLMISIQVLCHICWFEAQFWHKMGESFIHVRKHLNLCLNFLELFPLHRVLHKVKVFND